MDKWILVGPFTLVKEEQQESIISAGQVKVKITHVMITSFDALVFGGVIKTSYPVTPGRFAIGIVTEVGQGCYGVEVGNRVLMEATKGCGECFACKSGKEEACTDIKVAGKDFDGFLRDFVVCNYRDVSVLPDSVDDFQAICIEYVALAESIYDKLNLCAGQRVAIVGGKFFGNIMAQVLQYHKIIPIIVDNNAQNRENAQKAGVYYTFAADDELVQNVMDATCGQMCDAAVYNTSSKVSPAVGTSVIANHRAMVFGGFSNVNFAVNAQDIVEKQLSIFGLSNGYGYTATAINMLMHGAINLDMFDKQVLTEFTPKEIFEERLSDANTSNYSGMTIFKMIF